KNSAPPINPSSALVKASILASAVPISRDGDVAQGNENNASNNPTPNGNEGVGRLVLDNVMYFTPEDNWLNLADSSNIRKSRIYFVDNASGIATGQTHTYTISLCKNMLTRVVLVWSDYPGNVNCNTTQVGCLVNNLNLRVEKGSDFWNGNVRPTAPLSNDIDTTRMNVNIVDIVNNWEVVRIIPPKDTVYTIRVIGQNVPNGPQRYALVVSGGICQQAVSNDEDIKGKIYERIGNSIVFNSIEPILVRIYDIKGAKVLDQYIPSGISKIDISSFSKGIYVISIYKERRAVLVDKFIKD
ncbi:MAG: T9SS type A sorting domain-containing protein, partial [candidate division WOR-3 bacterium]|nr:T9SS type A sorting domain-containing protein [candidate division WOR-3 bacterium]MDW8150972.1 T9SS type A sorting domain-containing protein [candidate division WOR-3 bacterium]